MKRLIRDILNNDFSIYNYKSIRTIYNIDDIEFISCKQENYICITAINIKSKRTIKLDTKKYISLVDKLKTKNTIVTTNDGKIYIRASRINSPNKRVGYCRVSSKSQTENNSLEQQENEILNKFNTAIIYKEQFTGTTKERPIFKRVLSELNAGDTLVVTKLDRLARNTTEGIEIVQDLFNRDISVHVLNLGLLENTTMGKFFLTTLLAVAEMERNTIIERTKAGKEIARMKPNFKEGRPKKYTKEQLDNALCMLTINGGMYSYTEVERILNISKSTIIREQRRRVNK